MNVFNHHVNLSLHCDRDHEARVPCALPKDLTKRRKFHSTSSSFALQAFVEVSSQVGLESVVPQEDIGAN